MVGRWLYGMASQVTKDVMRGGINRTMQLSMLIMRMILLCCLFCFFFPLLAVSVVRAPLGLPPCVYSPMSVSKELN